MGSSSQIFASVTGIVSSVLGLVSTLLLVIFIALFFAAEPETYVNNFLRLIPRERRGRIRSTLSAINEALEKWLLTRVISMAIVGLLTGIGLFVIGIPLALSLGIIAAIGALISTFGPIFVLIPAILVALTQSPQQAIFVILLYVGVQMVDNYLITPFVQKSMLYLPPAYIIACQLLLGVLVGSLGLVLAAPLAAALVIIVRMLYVEDVLGDVSERAAE